MQPSTGVELQLSRGVELQLSRGVELQLSRGVELQLSRGVELQLLHFTLNEYLLTPKRLRLLLKHDAYTYTQKYTHTYIH